MCPKIILDNHRKIYLDDCHNKYCNNYYVSNCCEKKVIEIKDDCCSRDVIRIHDDCHDRDIIKIYDDCCRPKVIEIEKPSHHHHHHIHYHPHHNHYYDCEKRLYYCKCCDKYKIKKVCKPKLCKPRRTCKCKCC